MDVAEDVPEPQILFQRPGKIGVDHGGPSCVRDDTETDHQKPVVDRGRGNRLAGGYGDPLERDPARVLDDVLDGLISAETAERDYGVVIVAGSHVDAVATESARAARRIRAP